MVNLSYLVSVLSGGAALRRLLSCVLCWLLLLLLLRGGPRLGRGLASGGRRLLLLLLRGRRGGSHVLHQLGVDRSVLMGTSNGCSSSTNLCVHIVEKIMFHSSNIT